MNNWQRLEQVIKWTGMSTNAFAMAIGLKRSENLYQIKRGSFGISKELARMITTKYPMVNRSWLLTGDGQMKSNALGGNESDMVVSSLYGAIPFYQADIINLATGGNNIKPLYHLVLPMFNGASFAAPCAGSAMQSSVPHGSTVIVREIAISALLPGEVYLVVTNDFAVLRKIRTIESNNEQILLVADNREQFDDITLPKERISKLYIVMGVIVNKQG